MGYEVLNEKTVLEYLKGRPALCEIFANSGGIQSREIGDGNLNQVFILTGADNSSAQVVIKQALPYLRVAGDSWPLTRERMRFETQALLLYNELTPDLAPKVFDHDPEMSLVAMEYLGQHQIMRKPLVTRATFPHFVDHISTFMARTLFYTSDLYLTGLDKKNHQKQYINPHLCKIQEDFVYTNPYMDSQENQWNPELDEVVQSARSNQKLKIALAEMKASYMTHAQALLHGDLHTGSIMVKEDDTRVIDPEFAFYGPIGYDVGTLLANLALNFLAHYAHTPQPDLRTTYQNYLLTTIQQIWEQFAHKLDALWKSENCGELAPDAYWDFPGGDAAFTEYRRRYIARLLRDTAGHGGCEMLRRMMGIVSVSDIASIEDLSRRAFVENYAVRVGTRWVIERDAIDSIHDLIGIVIEETDFKPLSTQ